jgi:hypothetical protein
MPFKLALAPFKQQMLIFQREMKHMFVGGWKKLTHFMGDAFTRFIGKPLGQVMEDRILKPLRNLLGGLVNIAGKIVGGV